MSDEAREPAFYCSDDKLTRHRYIGAMPKPFATLTTTTTTTTETTPGGLGMRAID